MAEGGGGEENPNEKKVIQDAALCLIIGWLSNSVHDNLEKKVVESFDQEVLKNRGRSSATIQKLLVPRREQETEQQVKLVLKTSRTHLWLWIMLAIFLRSSATALR